MAKFHTKTEKQNIAGSTAITVAGYDHRERTLHLKMRDGTSLTYLDVPKEVYESLQKAESKGAYFNKYIRNNYALGG